MELSLFLSELFGLYFLIIAAVWLGRKKQFETAVKAIISSDGLLALTGVFQIVLGLAIAIPHSVWVFNWRVLITLIGYSLIIQGIFRLGFPQQARTSILKSVDKGYWVWIVFLVVVGLILTFYGFGGRFR